MYGLRTNWYRNGVGTRRLPSAGRAERTRAMDQRPLAPETISAAPRKKGSSRFARSSGCACSFAATHMPMRATDCAYSRLHSLDLCPQKSLQDGPARSSVAAALPATDLPAHSLDLNHTLQNLSGRYEPLHGELNTQTGAPAARCQRRHGACAPVHRCWSSHAPPLCAPPLPPPPSSVMHMGNNIQC